MPFLRRRGSARRRTPVEANLDATAPAAAAPVPPSPSGRDDDFQQYPPADRHHDDAASLRSSPAPEPPASDAADPIRLSLQQSHSLVAAHRDLALGHDETAKRRRFSILRFRNASDSQLSVRAKQQAERAPPVPTRPPEIITTAPTNDICRPSKRASRIGLSTKVRRSHDIPRQNMHFDGHNMAQFEARQAPPSSSVETSSPRASTQTTPVHSGVALAAPVPRQSESSRSDASSTDQTTPGTTPRKSQSSTSFFRMRKSKKPSDSLFGDLGHLPQKARPPPQHSSSTSLALLDASRPSSAYDRQPVGRQSVEPSESSTPSQPPPTAAALLAHRGGSRSGQSSPTRTAMMRGRSSTLSSIGGRDSADDHLFSPTARTSSSTGRKSFGDLLGLSRLRPNTELSRQGTMTPLTPGSGGSHNNSLQLTRAIVLPEKREDDSPAKYLLRVEDSVPRSMIAATLSKASDHFSLAVLRSYMRSFMFYGDPLDMAIRKLLMEAELPKETQHIDRCLQSFANRYHECNPGIYATAEQAYFAAFSLLILHTDVFNKNNKRKMTKGDYLKNTGGQGIFDDVLECFYDNISYTPFIHMEDDQDSNGDRASLHKSKRKQILAGPGQDPAKRAEKEPIDPYLLILDGNLDALRPNLKDVLPLDDTYNYLGTASSLNLKDLQKTFFRTGVLQIVSARSRPEAFMTDTTTSVAEAGPGIVDIKVTKVGLLWRKDVKKRKTRSPWQEWGAILTGAQLYFFRNVGWVKHLMHQYEGHVKSGNDGIPIIFKPPLQEFKPDALMSTQGAVALMDTSYKKHKNAFLYVRQGGLDEVLLADNEEEMNDWLAKLNYAAAFRTSGVKMRGVLGGNYDGQSRRGIRRHESSEVTQLVQTPTGPVSIARSQIDIQMVEDMRSARRQFMTEKIAEADAKLDTAHKELDDQLRNARHLQILAPIQPKTRAQLLSSAARMAAKLKWTRTEIWKETCHRDILQLDMDEDQSSSGGASTPSKSQPTSARPDRAASPTPPTTRRDSRHAVKSNSVRSHRPADIKTEAALGAEDQNAAESPSDQTFHTPPQSAVRNSRHDSNGFSFSDDRTVRQGSVSSGPVSPSRSQSGSGFAKAATKDGEDDDGKSDNHHGHDDVDADERDFLKQAGLLHGLAATESSELVASTTSADSGEQGSAGDREKYDKAKIRRSLQRTLREGAGHLSHHRSRKGKDATTSGAPEESQRDSMLSRGTGSFVVHGKKASVINLGTDLQRMPTANERLRGALQSEPPISPPTVSPAEDQDFHSILGDPRESVERRESAASASTATARSFRDLHRKYSTAQAAHRSASAGGRLAVPSDTDSENAASFSSDGVRTPLPPIEGEESNEPFVEVQGEGAPMSGDRIDDDGQASPDGSAGMNEKGDEGSSGPDDQQQPKPASSDLAQPRTAQAVQA